MVSLVYDSTLSNWIVTDVNDGTLTVSDGGTGAKSFTANGILLGNGTLPFTSVVAGLAGQVLQSNGANAPTFSTATYPSIAGTAGNILRSDGTNFVSTAINTAQSTSATARTATNTSARMMGYGTTSFITPARSGKVHIIITGNMSTGTANDGGQAQIAFGTGSAPANAAAATGTTVGQQVQFTSNNTANTFPFTVQGIATMTVGTAYWIDLQGAAVTGGTATMNNITITAVEL
jgi:hypothetical protein